MESNEIFSKKYKLLSYVLLFLLANKYFKYIYLFKIAIGWNRLLIDGYG
jgi:hypothetical protein